jgi:glycosyltransferase involved in cell wall biosynthesis
MIPYIRISMKVCIVSLNIAFYYQRSGGTQHSGAEVQAALLADAFAAEGLDVTFVVQDQRNHGDLPYPSENAYFTGEGLPGTRFLWPRVPGLLGALRRADADVYFQHCAGLATGLTAWHCRRNRRVFVYFAGSDSDFSFREARVGNLRDRAIFYWGLKNASGIVAQSVQQADLCRKKLGRDPRVIPSAVALTDTAADQKDGSVVWVGTLRAVKRPELFLDLARRLPRQRFVLIGGAIESEKEFARRIVDEAASVENVIVTGRLPHHEVDRYVTRASLLVNTSSVEGFPNAFLEAWQRGTPTLSFVDVDGLIASEEVGILCRDLDHMERSAADLLGSEARRADMGAQARKLVESRYAAPKLAKEYKDFFEQLLSARDR